MHCIGDHFVAGSFFRRGELRAKPTLFIWRDTAGNDHAHATARAFRKKLGHAQMTVFSFFETSMHRAHECPVLDCRKPEIKRCKQMWIAVYAGHDVPP